MKNDEQQAIQLDRALVTEQIKANIQEQGYDDSILDFHQTHSCINGENQNSYNALNFESHVKQLNENYNIPLDREEPSGNKLKRLFQKVIKKLVRFYMEPVVSEQVRYNSEVTQTMNQVQLFHIDTQQDIDELNRLLRSNIYDMSKRIQELERELELVKSELAYYKKKEDSKNDYEEIKI